MCSVLVLRAATTTPVWVACRTHYALDIPGQRDGEDFQSADQVLAFIDMRRQRQRIAIVDDGRYLERLLLTRPGYFHGHRYVRFQRFQQS